MKEFIFVFILITIISVFGYFLLFYGGYKSELESSRNLYLTLGEILMWPWFLVNIAEKYINFKNDTLEFSVFWIFQYAGYLILFYLIKWIKIKV